MLNLKAIEARCERATKGPWSPHHKFVCHSEIWSDVRIANTECVHGHEIADDEIRELRRNDSDFIAHARTDLPEAIRVIREAREMFVQALQEVSSPTDNLELIYRVNQWLSQVKDGEE